MPVSPLRPTRLLLAVAAVAAGVALSSCAAGQSPRIPSPAPLPPAPTALPAGWQETPVTVKAPSGTDAGVWLHPGDTSVPRAAAVLIGPTGSDPSGGASRGVAVVLAHDGVPTLRVGGPPAPVAYADRLAQATAAANDLAGRPGVSRGRLLAVGQGDGAPIAAGLAGAGNPAVKGTALLEPQLAPPTVTGVPPAVQLSLGLPRNSHNLITCSDSDPTVHCGDVQGLVDTMGGTHPNYVQLSGVDADLAAVPPGGGQRALSPELAVSIGTWVSMQ
ncbi:hypothetical protein P0W64_14000 [Tsukamurella sp. 8F]|uniref:hypothetical protein n=1 Tax=unclassified Tsukamurella TaxID=2633480 RepID=UPI0023B9B7D7|nr:MULTISPECIES: hypothetical protein [unclassified Tsukamurella]MDF0530686.1 hypothetical protein [Tsukamurella sp. 8J]MDF0587887.1 hypothetical protein [Tsukamurella sp. 8F]